MQNHEQVVRDQCQVREKRQQRLTLILGRMKWESKSAWSAFRRFLEVVLPLRARAAAWEASREAVRVASWQPTLASYSTLASISRAPASSALYRRVLHLHITNFRS